MKISRRNGVAVGALILGAIFLATTPSEAKKYSWQPIAVTTEPLIVSNLITTNPHQDMPCTPTAKDNDAIAQTPPAIQDFGTITLEDYAVSVAWSPDGKYIATANTLGAAEIKIWSFPQLKLLHTIYKKSEMGGQEIEFTKDGKFLITTTVTQFDGVSPNAFSLIDVNTGEVVREIAGYSDPPTYPLANSSDNFRFSQDGRYFFSTFDSNVLDLYIYDTKTWSIIANPRHGITPIISGPGPSQIAYIDQIFDSDDLKKNDKTASFLIWDGNKKAFVYRAKILNYFEFRTSAAAISATNCTIALGASGVRTLSMPANSDIENPADAIKLWYPNRHIVLNLSGATPIEVMVLNIQTPLLAYVDGNNQIVVDFIPGIAIGSIKKAQLGHFGNASMDLKFSPNGKFLAVSGDNKIKIYSIEIKMANPTTQDFLNLSAETYDIDPVSCIASSTS